MTFQKCHKPWNKGLIIETDERVKKMSGAQKGKSHSSYHKREGCRQTEEAKKRISQTLKGHLPWNTGKSLSEEHKKNISEGNRGKTCPHPRKGWHWSKEMKQKLSQAHKGKKFSDEHKKRLSETHKGLQIGENNPFYGKYHTDETKKKIGESNKGQIPWIKGKHHSEEAKKKMSLSQQISQIGESNSNWKGGRNSLANRIRKTFRYRQWRSDVFTRDDFTCQNCGRRGIKINAHHVMPLSFIFDINDIKIFEQAMECEELWNINNGVTFCEKCHNLTKKGRKICLREVDHGK